ncbi:MAG: toll/interleukin-1 receptor domain-containing protein [Chloroflexota bacterium]
MEQRFSKPRVFLSHSKKNSAFIERLAEDLRKSQIDPWLDTYEIRHGKSWQDYIFEYGLPTCDAILVYFTEFSILSPVVKKEMDVGLLQKLKDNNVAFLPYVDSAKTRDLLRPDIQALQTPEWNDTNYYSLLPRVVAEIWRSFLERTVATATRDERLRRAELELELEKSRNQTENFFTTAETAEFDFIWKSFDKVIPLVINQKSNSPNPEERASINSYMVNLELSTLIACLSNYVRHELEFTWIKHSIQTEGMKFLGIQPQSDEERKSSYFVLEGFPNIMEQLLMYGLVESLSYPTNFAGRDSLKYETVLSKKYFRYRYWLAYNRKLPESICFKPTNNS